MALGQLLAYVGAFLAELLRAVKMAQPDKDTDEGAMIQIQTKRFVIGYVSRSGCCDGSLDCALEASLGDAREKRSV